MDRRDQYNSPYQHRRKQVESADSISNSVSEQSTSYPVMDSSSDKDTGSPSKSLCSSASSSSENVQAMEMKVYIQNKTSSFSRLGSGLLCGFVYFL